MKLHSLAMLLLVVLALRPASTAAQQTSCPEGSRFNGNFCERIFEMPTWVGHSAALGANALLGGLAGGIAQELRGGEFRDGFSRGVLGGVVLWAGKRVAVQRGDAAGIAGRQIGAVGASIVRNAGEGRGTFSQLVFPVGPARLYVRTDGRPRLHAKLDLVALAWTAYAVAEDELEFEPRESLRSGAIVFHTTGRLLLADDSEGRPIAGGSEAAGVILASDVPAYGSGFLRRSIRHERVHVLQDDYIFLAVHDPIETWVLQQVPHGRTFDRYFDVNLSNSIRALVGLAIPERENQPWELEAEFLERHR